MSFSVWISHKNQMEAKILLIRRNFYLVDWSFQEKHRHLLMVNVSSSSSNTNSFVAPVFAPPAVVLTNPRYVFIALCCFGCVVAGACVDSAGAVVGLPFLAMGGMISSHGETFQGHIPCWGLCVVLWVSYRDVTGSNGGALVHGALWPCPIGSIHALLKGARFIIASHLDPAAHHCPPGFHYSLACFGCSTHLPVRTKQPLPFVFHLCQCISLTHSICPCCVISNI